MATYRITAPDGGTYEITAPDTATEADVFKMVSSQFAQPVLRPALEGTVTPKSLPPAEQAKQMFGLDVTQPVETVRAAIAQLPEDKRKKATDLWADHYVATEHRGGKGIENVVRGMARGTPVGSWLDEASAGTIGLLNTVTGGKLGAPYDESLAYYRARDRQFDTENPKTSMGLQIGGAVASAPFTPMLTPFRGVSMLGKMGNAAATGATYGTVYGAGLGEDGLGDRATEAAKGLALGAGVGAAAAPVATGLANAYKYTRDALRPLPPELAGMSRGAVQRVNRALQDDQLYIPAPSINNVPPPPGAMANYYPAQAKALGREGMLADMGANLTGQAAGLATTPGRGKEIVKSALQQRAAGAKDRIATDTNQVLGPARDLVQVEEAMTRAANNRANPLYEQFYQTAVKPSENLYGLLDRAKAAGAFDRAQKLMQVDGFDPADLFYQKHAKKGPDNAALNGRSLDYIKRAVDDLAGEAERSGSRESLRRYSSLAKGIRDEVDRALSPQDPTKSIWAQARSAAGEGLQFSEALDEGRKAFSRGTNIDQMRADLRGMNNLQRDAYREGARGQIRDIMGNAATAAGENGASAARRALGSDFAREKLGMVTQPQRYQAGVVPPPPNTGDPGRLIARLDAETRFAGTANDVLGNSKTAERLAAQKEIPNPASRDEIIGDLGRRDWSGALMQGGAKALNAMMGGAINARNARITEDMARLLTAQGKERDTFARAIMGYGNSRAVTQAQKDNLERILNKLLQAPRQHVISSAN